jgi:stage II sporulation protein D
VLTKLLSICLAIIVTESVNAFENPPIRVRLESSRDQLELEGLGVQIQGRAEAFEKVAIPQTQKILIQRAGDKAWKIQRSGQTEIIQAPYLALKAIQLRAKGKSLPNQIFLAPKQASKFDVIGILPLENYLVGVLSSEMPLSWPVETLKAQAIAARSYALALMRERAKSPFHVESTILDQVFTHISMEQDSSPLIQKAKLAVQATEGMILMTPTGKTLKAYYHSDCGGQTSSSKSVWGFGTSTGSAVDSSCATEGHHLWKLNIAEETLSEKLQRYLKKMDLGPLQSFSLIRPGPQTRVEKVELAWQNGQKTQISAHDFRAAIGFDQLRSTFFEVQKKNNQQYEFSGKGFGHGVGLCQWGARELGKEGRDYLQILSHYYPQAILGPGESRLQAKTELEPAEQTR